MNAKFFKGPVLALLAAAVLLGGSTLAQAAPDSDKPAKPKSKKTKAKSEKAGAAGTGGKVKFIRGSEETPAQRSARLKRECKGGVNAGACAGYTN
ncbi:hypothetical protein SAMN05216350_103288 [Polaromonas sp. YR568]|uniref:hypothetical protein n=1 Tax=Polaromonas sp. YR568 TaxID=1855301 RepID=UPI0008E967E9|nr:hypothetical protein [Polaromonas sp. YR568]SFU63803.1 hypothetical protein SAMN05216350_103288 [Polaromonas sp. YR568]